MKLLRVLDNELKVRVSPSFLRRAACPLALRLEYVDKVPTRFTRTNARAGTAAHEAIAKLTELAMENRIQPREFDNKVIEEYTMASCGHDLFEQMGEVLEWVTKWRDNFRLDHKAIVGVEERVAINEQHEECAWDVASYRGILDLIEVHGGKDAVITDHKSQPNVLSQTELDRHEQLTFYCWLNSKFYPSVKTYRARIFYLRYGFYAETERTHADIQAFERILEMKVRKIMDIQSWDPVPGDHCGMCDFVDRCSFATELPEVPRHIITQEQAAKAAGYVHVIDNLSKALKAKLRAYVKDNDSVRLDGDIFYGYAPKRSSRYPFSELREILEEAGHDVAELSNLDKRKVTKLLKELRRDGDDETADRIEAIAIEEVKTRFGLHKVGVEEEDDLSQDPGEM